MARMAGGWSGKNLTVLLRSLFVSLCFLLLTSTAKAADPWSLWGPRYDPCGFGCTGPAAGTNGRAMTPAAPHLNTTCGYGMCAPNAQLLSASLNLNDTPVGYTPPRGPAVFVKFTYNHLEASQPASFQFTNLGRNWTFNFLSYVQDNPASPGVSVTRYVDGGGSIDYSSADVARGYSGGTFGPELLGAAILSRVPATGAATSYRLSFPDGSAFIYDRFDGATTFPRRVFLTKIVDPAGQALTLGYDSVPGPVGGVACPAGGCQRLVSITDASGHVTTLGYDPASPVTVRTVTDPFGRAATIGYDAKGRLASIQDVIGIISAFGYDDSSGGDPAFINILTTPYGVSRFAQGSRAGQRWLELTDAAGATERVEYLYDAAPGLPGTEVVPKGMVIEPNGSFNRYNTYVWDGHAYAASKAANGGQLRYADARSTHWTHDLSTGQAMPVPASTKAPLESRVHYQYAGWIPSNANYTALTAQPGAIGRILDDGTTQLRNLLYNDAGRVTGITDPFNPQSSAPARATMFDYAANNVDLVTIRQKTASGPALYTNVTTFGAYNSAHKPSSVTDASGRTTRFAYNEAGQVIYETDALNRTRFWEYDAAGRLSRVTVPVAAPFASVVYGTTNAGAATAASFTYDAADRVATRTDSEGHVLGFAYDAMDRLTRVTFPDATTLVNTYDPVKKLDLVGVTDRMSRVTALGYDPARRLTSVTEPIADGVTRVTGYAYYENGALKSITDPNSHVTSWDLDVQSRPIVKHYADGKAETVVYETTTSRVRSTGDAFTPPQITSFTYNIDDTLAKVTYTGAAEPTAAVSFTYDTFWPRRTSMTDGTGTTTWTYVPVGKDGALQLLSEDGPAAAHDVITYAYDELGRPSGSTVDGEAETFHYDLLGRLDTETNALGGFAYFYLGQTDQLKSRALTGTGIASGTAALALDYQANINDRVLKSITWSGPNDALVSQYGYAFDGNRNVTTFTHRYPGQNLGVALSGLSAQGGAVPPVLTRRSGSADASETASGNAGRFLVTALFAAIALVWLLARRLAQVRKATASGLAMAALAVLFASCGDGSQPSPFDGGPGDGGVGADVAGQDGTPPGDAPEGEAGRSDAAQDGPGSLQEASTGPDGGSDGGTSETGAPGPDGGAVDAPGDGPEIEEVGTGDASALVTLYGYDRSNRLVSATLGTDVRPPKATQTPQFSYGYDPASNVTSITAAGATRSQPVTVTNALAAGTYDANGNLTALDGVAYRWDAANRLIAVVKGAQESAFTYDGLSRMVRIVEKTGGVVTADHSYVWCGEVRCLERDNLQTGSPVTKRYFAQGFRAGSQSFYYVMDMLGSVRAVVDATGAVRARYDYDPYGNRTKLAGDVDADMGYAGLFQHGPSGLALAVYRAYDPTRGRWLNRDPIGERGGLNLYGYVDATPLVRTDPNGLMSISLDFYFGPGFGITLGIDERTRQPFFSVRAGFGLGGGLGIDLVGTAPGEPLMCEANSLGAMTVSAFAELSGEIYGLSVGLKGEFGLRKEKVAGLLHEITGQDVKSVVSTIVSWPLPERPVFSVGKPGVRFGGAAGVEIAIIGRRPATVR